MDYYGQSEFTKMLTDDVSEQLKKDIPATCTVALSQRQLCDLEMLLNNALHPLNGFMNEAEYYSVLENISLNNGLFWTMPITLDVSKEQIDSFAGANKIGLSDKEGFTRPTRDIESY